jgi:hypothetical protein
MAWTPFAGAPNERVIQPPLKRPLTTRVNSVDRHASSTAAVNSGAQLAPALVPMFKFGSVPSKSRGITDRIE